MVKFLATPTLFVYSSFVSFVPSKICSGGGGDILGVSHSASLQRWIKADTKFLKYYFRVGISKSSPQLPCRSLHAPLEQGNPLRCSFPFTLFTLHFYSLPLYFLPLSCPLRGKLGLTDPNPRPALTYRPHPTISSTVKWLD